MLIPLSWLKEYVNIDGLTPEVISEALTNAGLEVESIQQVGARFSGVVVAQIQTVEPHPNADKLRLVTVNCGSETMRVVCGAPNVRSDIRIAFAKVGAQVLNRKDGTPWVLTPAQIRGVESSGMICSLDELGLQDQFSQTEDGIWVLDKAVSSATPLGMDLQQALMLESDVIIETAPTANRGDLMSIIGVAREVAALFDRELSLPNHLPPSRHQGPIQMVVHLNEPDVCTYYGGAVLRNLTMTSSPDWMVRRLTAAGVRSINNIVDITNYVMLETGQPLHAFDQTKLGIAGEIDVRRAREGEVLKTLDDTERTLTEESVLITVNRRPIALAGVMGGATTEVDDYTHMIFLECAHFPSATTRRSAKSVGLRSEASARFERGVDSASCKGALYRAIALYVQYAGAEYVNMTEAGLSEPKALNVPLRLRRMEQVLGMSIPSDQVQAALHKLGFQMKPSKEKDVWSVVVPSYRQVDVYREIDLIEEVVRIYGYDRIPYTLPQRTDSSCESFRQRLLKQVRAIMAGAGLQETVTTSLIGEALIERAGLPLNADEMVKVTNSNSQDHTTLRQSLLPNLIEVAKFNQAQGAEHCWLFELGRGYFKKGKSTDRQTGVVEKLFLSGLVSGSMLSGDWKTKEEPDFYLVKGILERLFGAILPESLTVGYAATESVAFCHPGKTAEVSLGSGQMKAVGFVGELHPLRQHALKFRQPVYVFEIDLDAVYKQLKQAQDKPVPIRISAFPSVKRDVAFSAKLAVRHQEVVKTILGLREPLIRDVALFDEYRGAQLGEGVRSLAYRLTLQSEEETLTDAAIDAVMAKVRDTLVVQHEVTLR